MDIMQSLIKLVGGNVVEKISKQFGISGEQTENVFSKFAGILTSGGAGVDTVKLGGLAGMLKMAGDFNAERFLDGSEDITGEAGIAEGNNILSKFLGGEEKSTEVAGEVAKETGIDSSVLMKMLPVVAVVAVGAMKKFSSMGAGADGEGGLSSMLTGMLDKDGDGKVVDDLADMAKKFLS